MTREEAVLHILYLSSSVAGEFCCSAREEDDARQETTQALNALGVTDVELEELNRKWSAEFHAARSEGESCRFREDG